jgi:hypothetical protein
MVAAGVSLRQLRLAATFETTMDRAALKFQKEDSPPPAALVRSYGWRCPPYIFPDFLNHKFLLKAYR